MKLERELMRGAGPTAVLQLLSRGEMYGYQLVESLASESKGVFKLGQSTLYPMLYNMETKGLVVSTRKEGPNGRKRRYYRLTTDGKKRLEKDREQWAALVKAMGAFGVTRDRPSTADLPGGLIIGGSTA
ncbi:MAG: helix-turn-helix transcriptional regulator [Planctomycetota bacterium]